MLRTSSDPAPKHVLDLKLFGLKATGQDVEKSDIDVPVVVDQKTSELEDRVLDVAFDVNVADGLLMSDVSDSP